MQDNDIVKEAEDFVKGKDNFTTSQIRKFLSAVNALQNKVIKEDEDLSEDFINEIKYLKVKLAYQTGRYKSVKPLFDELNGEIDTIKTKKKFKEFARRVEAIVAYHKFYKEQGEN